MLSMLRSRLFLRQFLTMFLLALALSLSLVVAVLVRSTKSLESRELDIVATYRDTVRDSMDRWLDGRVRQVSQAAREVAMTFASGGDVIRASKHLSLITELDSAFVDMVLFDSDGRVVAARTGPVKARQDISSRDYIKAALAGEPYISGLFKGLKSGSPIFAVSQPVTVGGEVWGVAGVITLANLSDIVDKLNLHGLGVAMLVDETGAIVSSPEFIEAYQAGIGKPGNAQIRGEGVGHLQGGSPGVAIYVNHRGVRVAGGWTFIPRLRLGLIVELDNDKAMKPLLDLLRFITVLSGAMVILFIVASYLLASGLVRPITRLIAAVNAVRSDRYQSSIDLKTGTELDELVTAFNEMSEAVKRRETDLRDTASRDSLTGLYNHGMIELLLEREIKRKRRSGGPVCFVMLDIDHFKTINDSYGHQAGDEVLRKIASLMNEAIRGGDSLGRYGGEEFAVILDAKDEDEAGRFCERVRAAVEATQFPYADKEIRLTVSLGYVCASADGAPYDIIRRADRGLYDAKNAGRNAIRQG